jgi:HEAT repeat protein
VQPEQRRNAATLFAALGDGERLSLLVKDEDAMVREAAVSSIGKLKIATAAGSLLIALVDEAPDVRLAAAEALGMVADLEVVAALTRALDDDDSWVQCAALRSLARISPDAAIQAIHTLSPQAGGVVLITCLELLEGLTGEGCRETAEQALDNSDMDVVTLAIDLLARHSVERIIPHAGRLLAHQNWNVRIVCARAVARLSLSEAGILLSDALEHEENELVRTQLHKLLKERA